MSTWTAELINLLFHLTPNDTAMIYEVVINGIVYRATLVEIHHILADERENLG